MEENGATAVTECRRRATTPYRPHRSVFVADDAAKDIQTTSFFQFPTKFLSLKHVSQLFVYDRECRVISLVTIQ